MNEHSTGITTNKISEQNEENNEQSIEITTNKSSKQNEEINEENLADEDMAGC